MGGEEGRKGSRENFQPDWAANLNTLQQSLKTLEKTFLLPTSVCFFFRIGVQIGAVGVSFF